MAADLDVPRTTLYRKLKSLGVVTAAKSGGRVAYVEDDEEAEQEA